MDVLKKRRNIIIWQILNIKGISPSYYIYKILMEIGHKPTIKRYMRLSPNMQKVIKNEVVKLSDGRIIYPISDSSWATPIYCIPKKEGMIIMKNKEEDLIPTKVVSSWRVYIDYRKLNAAIRKDYFPLPFIDKVLE